MPMSQNRDSFEFEGPRSERCASSPGGFVPLTSRFGSAGLRHMSDSLSAHAIRGRLQGQGLKRGGKNVINDLVEELNDGICPEDDYSARSVLQTLHQDLAAGRQTIDFASVKEQALEALERLKATLPEKKEKKPFLTLSLKPAKKEEPEDGNE